jgi:phage shock protein A
VLGPTPAELDNAREQLDQAQEELVGLMERCDRLEQELEVARRKNRVYQVTTAELYSVCWRVMVTLWHS